MKEMKKDKTIESAFRGYFEGAELPPCDLEQIKRRYVRRKRGIFWKVTSAFACVLFLCVLSVGIFLGRGASDPARTPIIYYTLSSAQAESVSYAQLSDRYENQLRGLSPFAWAENAQASYTLYFVDGEEALIGAHLRYLRGLDYWEGELYIDLSGGTLLPEELRALAALEESGSIGGRPYALSTEYTDGEYLSEAKLTLPAGAYYMTIMGSRKSSADFLLQLLAKNS